MTAPFGMGPGNTVDIGIFDSRGHEFVEAPGFRGWSGTAKREFFIAPDCATPGYIRGPLFPGEWNVMLGVDRIQPAGARDDVTVTLTTEANELHHTTEPATTLLPARPEALVGRAEYDSPIPATTPRHGRWLRGDLHCHTVHSDGLNSVEDIVRHAVNLGLDFLAVTDHNTTTHHEELDRLSSFLEGPITLIPGEEVTTYWGHANTWGLREWVDFRCGDEESMRSLQRWVREKGAMLSINHPKCVGPPWLFEGWDGFPAMEVWQAPWRFYNWESLERWDGLLRQGERVVAVGGSDTHSIPPAPPRHPHGLAEPTTWVFVDGSATPSLPARPEVLVGRAERSTDEGAILDAIRKGHVFVSDAPNGAHLILTADEDGDGRFEKMMGDTVEAPEGKPVDFRVQVRGGMDRRLWLISDGVPIDIIPLSHVDTDYRFSLEPAGRSYLRAELRGYRGRPERGEVIWAMTNPIWLQATPRRSAASAPDEARVRL
ncbi:MAG: hypothetical protein E6J42_07180 [Chloroflexi bacterium]|nr:MAG: hypothetical protein E6J42_07180 [Chloroflexota bacterium]